MPRVAIVLPPREAFSEAAGAVATIAHLHARHGRLPAIVLGRPVAQPFADIQFQGIKPRWRLASPALRYAAGVAAALHTLRPALVEVHNRPDVALHLARHHRVTLFLHNDPAMPAARTAAQRARLRARVARVLAVSPWVAEKFGAGPGGGVLPNAIDLTALPLPPGERRTDIVFAGRVVADKGADLFVDACALALPRLPGWSAKMLGADRFGADSPDTPFLRALRPRAASAGVVMTGWQPRDAVLAALAQAAIVVMPGRWPEPFGLVALEAMALGAALIFAPTGGLPDLVADAGLPVPPEPARLAEAIVALAGDPARRAALGEAGRKRAERFSIARVAAALDAERDRILATWPAPGGDTI